MISRPLLFLCVLLSAPLVARALVSPPSVVPSKAVSPTRLNAFQVPNMKQFRPRSNNRDYEPYDWTNDRLEHVDTESERPWKMDELIVQDDECESLVTTPQSRLSKWNPFSSKQPTKREPPINSRARLSTTDAGTLVVDLPATGMDSSAISSGVFGALWFSSILPITLAGGLATGVFMVPFWLAGSLVAKNALVDPFVGSQLTIGEYAYSVTSTFGSSKKDLRKVEGSTQDLRGAMVERTNVEVNGKTFYQLQLYGNKGITSFGHGLDPEELEYLAHVINEQLQGFQRNQERGESDMFGFISRGGREAL